VLRATISGGAGQRPISVWEPAATAAFSRHAQCYGTHHLRAELSAEEHVVGRHALHSWLRRRGLQALSTRPHRLRTTVADPEAVVAENLLLGHDRVHHTQSGLGWEFHLPAVSRRALVSSGHLARYLLAARSGLAPRTAHAHRAGNHRPGASSDTTPASSWPDFHADRGSQYTSSACHTRIEKAQAQALYSRPGTPSDNAQAEAGWSKLKTELLPPGSAFANLEEARLEVAYYLDTYFNLDRRHSALGYRSSHQLECDLQTSIS